MSPLHALRPCLQGSALFSSLKDERSDDEDEEEEVQADKQVKGRKAE